MLSPSQPGRAGAMNVLAALLEQRTGQQIQAGRQWRIETALKPLLRARDLPHLDALVGEVLSGRSPALAEAIVDALLNQESSFFRDGAVLDLVADAALEAQTARAGARARIWSAGCSTGQEPLSLAMLFAERGSSPAPEILATDVSEAAIARARAGRFSQFEIQRGLPVRRMIRWFETEAEEWVAAPELVRAVGWRKHNLVTDPLPAGRFDVVLCRNVLLYFTPQVRRVVLDRIAEVIRPGGTLVLGAGETVIGQSDAFAPSREYRGLYTALPRPIPPRRAIG